MNPQQPRLPHLKLQLSEQHLVGDFARRVVAEVRYTKLLVGHQRDTQQQLRLAEYMQLAVQREPQFPLEPIHLDFVVAVEQLHAV